MNFTLSLPSLKHIALVKIATTLWNQDDVRDLITKLDFPFFRFDETWSIIEDRVIQKVPKLPQPEPLKKEVLGFIKPIGLQILEWMEYYGSVFDLDCVKKDMSKLVWTPQGTVNRKETAQVLIKDESLDISERYALACRYCLRKDIRALWDKMPENCRHYFYSEDPRNVRQHGLVVLWTYVMEGEITRIVDMIERRQGSKCLPYQYALQCASASGIKAATEYFLEDLVPECRKESLEEAAGYVPKNFYSTFSNHTELPKERYTDVLCFLLSQMDEEQQIEVFKEDPGNVLIFLLNWPWQSLFMETANRMWDFLQVFFFDYLLKIIVGKVIDGFKDYDYQELFGEFWKQSPNDFKRYVINECSYGLLSKLFKIKDDKNIKLILRSVTLIKKRKLFFRVWGHIVCQNLVYVDERGLLEFFIQECVSSKDEIIQFKMLLLDLQRSCCLDENFANTKDKWDKCFHLLDDFICGLRERKSVKEGDSDPAKLESAR